ncbi:hypothetical protein MPLDJ20_100052 [Mesorhizobium plurifarium]|uniref:Uncharacterized protein n=1 Tax=Mesorhizobium plurifarium TaxID=69974 RepID=A0A090DEU1_MESPL|nr:hypothetical protein MPLDJ20_100052 [Mesorhizobium plurifarium]CDX38807.1 hypothetical protein MPLSOD_340053 [Mesorhizobium sp. SOD10]
MATISISMPADHAREYQQLWKELRLADALDLEHDLGEPIEVGNFDGANLVQWVVDLEPVLVPLVTASLAYLITSRGEFEYEKDGEKIRFKNLKPSQVKEVFALLDTRDKG